MKLNDLKIGDECYIKKVLAKDDIKKRLLDIGFIKGVLVSPILKNESMTAYRVKGTIIGIRNEDTKDIEVSL